MNKLFHLFLNSIAWSIKYLDFYLTTKKFKPFMTDKNTYCIRYDYKIFLFHAQEQLVAIFMEYSQVTIFKSPNNKHSQHLKKLILFLMRQLWHQFKHKLNWHCNFERNELPVTNPCSFLSTILLSSSLSVKFTKRFHI